MPRRTQQTDTEVTQEVRGALSMATTVAFAAMRQEGTEAGEPHATTRALMSGTATQADRAAHILAALVTAGLTQGRITPPATVPHVSPRQYEVLTGIAAGLSNTELAAHCFMNVQTVKGHQGAMYRRFGVNTRVELVVEAVRCGILSAPTVERPARRTRRPRTAPATAPATAPVATDEATDTEGDEA